MLAVELNRPCTARAACTRNVANVPAEKGAVRRQKGGNTKWHSGFR